MMQLNRETFGEVRTADVHFFGYGVEEAPWSCVVPFRDITEVQSRPHEWGVAEVLFVDAGEVTFSCNLDGGWEARTFVSALQLAWESAKHQGSMR